MSQTTSIHPVIPQLTAWITKHERNGSFVARAIGVSPSTVKRWLDSSRSPSEPAVWALQKFLRKNP